MLFAGLLAFIGVSELHSHHALRTINTLVNRGSDLNEREKL